MTKAEFIGAAVLGGWEPDLSIPNHSSNFYRILLDPKAWEAVYKACEWYKEENQKDWLWELSDAYTESYWQLAMYGMITQIIKGKTIDQFLEAL